jgi:hypothetical protein
MSKIGPDPEEQLTLDDKIIERLQHDMGEDAAMVIESYVESIDEFRREYQRVHASIEKITSV